MIAGRKLWRIKSKDKQRKIKKLRDNIRGNKRRITTLKKHLMILREKQEKDAERVRILEAKVLELDKSEAIQRTKEEGLEAHRENDIPLETEIPIEGISENKLRSKQVVSVLLYFFAQISFRGTVRVLDFMGSHLGLNIETCHFTSVINWALIVSKHRLDSVKPSEELFSLIVDSSIKWGLIKITAALRVPTNVLQRKKGALCLEDVEVVGIWVHSVSNGKVISQYLSELFEKIGIPYQILSDSGSDLIGGIKSLPFSGIHTRDIGHFIGALLKKKYANDPDFQEFITFATTISQELRQTAVSWIVPNKLRKKGRFQGISIIAKWADRTFTLLEKGLGKCSKKEESILKKTFQKHKHYHGFAQSFYAVTEVLNNVQKVIKDNGLNEKSYKLSLQYLQELDKDSEIRISLEKYLLDNNRIGKENKIESLIMSTDVIESLFGKMKYNIERSPVKEIGRLALLLPLYTKIPSAREITEALETISIKELREWEKVFFPTTRRKEMHKHFGIEKKKESKTGGNIAA